MIKQWKIDTITGNTTGTTARPINGRLIAVYVDYNVTPNAGTDVVIATVNEPVKTLLTLTDNVTDGWYYPLALAQDLVGADLTAVYSHLPISDYVSATVAQGDADQTLDVWLLVECD